MGFLSKTFLLRLTFILAFISLGFGIYTYTEITRKLSLTQAELALLKQEQALYSETQAQALLKQAELVKGVQSELDVTKKESLDATSKLSTLEATFVKEKATSANTVISSTDISTLLNGVPQVVCKQLNGSISSGSATLWKFSDIPYGILTNKHVIQNAEKCVVVISNKDSTTQGVYALSTEAVTFNKHTDTAAVIIQKAVSTNAPALSSFNYGISALRKCPSTISLGSPVVIIGFPAYARRDTEINLETMGKVKVIYRTVTNGIVSGYDSSEVSPKGNLQEPNFFISAKIDSGNSGGIALAKDSNGMCVLGIPTWLTVGNYETQGLVQNIRNVLP